MPPLFGKPKYTTIRVSRKKSMPEGLWTRCEDCGEIIYNKALEENFRVCPKCNYHFILSAPQRITLLTDPSSFKEFDTHLRSLDPLSFKGPKGSYPEKLKEDQSLTKLSEARLIIIASRVVKVMRVRTLRMLVRSTARAPPRGATRS